MLPVPLTPSRRAGSTPSPFTPGEAALLAAFVEHTRLAFGSGGIERILAFGSRARGQGHEDSDLDLAVFARQGLPRDAHRTLAAIAEEAQEGREDLPHLRPILIRADEHTNPRLIRTIEREGIELWARKSA